MQMSSKSALPNVLTTGGSAGVHIPWKAIVPVAVATIMVGLSRVRAHPVTMRAVAKEPERRSRP